MNPRPILVALDGQRASETALPTAVERARAGASLYLLYVLVTAPTTADSPRHRAAALKARRYLEAVRQRIESDSGVNVSTAVWSGSAPAAIVKAADLIDAEMIVMARSGPTGPPRRLVGSVVERVVRGTRRPVLVVTPADAVVDSSLGQAAPLPDGPPAAPESAASNTPRVTPAGPRSWPGDTYLEALRSVAQCEREAHRVVTTVQEAAKSLERWQAVHVAHSGAGFPKEVTMTGRVIDAASWPTGQQLADTLAAWHSSAETARVAWERIPREERETLPRPP